MASATGSKLRKRPLYITYKIPRGTQLKINGPYTTRNWAVRKLDWSELLTRLVDVPRVISFLTGINADAMTGALMIY